jgi:hypothetical protein
MFTMIILSDRDLTETIIHWHDIVSRDIKDEDVFPIGKTLGTFQDLGW